MLQSFNFNFNFHSLLQIMTCFSGIFLGLLNHQVASDAMCVMPPRLVEEVPVATLPFWGFRKSDFKTFKKRWRHGRLENTCSMNGSGWVTDDIIIILIIHCEISLLLRTALGPVERWREGVETWSISRWSTSSESLEFSVLHPFSMLQFRCVCASFSVKKSPWEAKDLWQPRCLGSWWPSGLPNSAKMTDS